MGYGLNPSDDSFQESMAQVNPYVPDLSPSFAQNAGTAISQQYGKGALATENLIGDFADPVIQSHKDAIDSLFGNGTVNDIEDYRANAKDAIINTQIDPVTTGWLGQTLGGFAGISVPAALGSLAGPLAPVVEAGLIGGTQYKNTKLELMDKGVNETTATKAAAVEGGVNAVMPFLPFGIAAKYGGDTLLGKIAAGSISGATINTALGAASRKATSTILADGGYDQMAQQYKALDGMAIFSDALLGGFFGAVHAHAVTPEEKQQNLDANLPSDTDAALAANDVQNLEIDSAPGIPIDAVSRDAHVEAMTTATQQLLRGEDVNVSGIMIDSTFLPHEQADIINNAWDNALREQRIMQSSPELLAAIQSRDSKLIEIQSKHDDVAAQLDQLRARLDQLNSEISRPLTQSEKVAFIDPAAGMRLQQIEHDLLQSNLTTKQKTALESERQLVMEGGNYPENIIKESTKGRMSDLISQRDSVLSDVKKQQKDLNRYAGEAVKRQKKIIEQKALLIPDEIVPLSEESVSRIGDNKKSLEKPLLKENVTTDNAEQPTVSTKEAPIDKAQTDLATQIVTEKPDITIPISETENLTASEALAQADHEISYAAEISKLIQVAANCFIRNGQ